MFKKLISRLIPSLASAPPKASDAPPSPATRPQPERSVGSGRPRGRTLDGAPPAASSHAPTDSSSAPSSDLASDQADAPPKRRRRRRGKPSGEAVAPPRVESVTGPQPRETSFGSVMVSAPVSQALTEMGYTEPTPIQEAVIAQMLDGVDLVGQAQTGTGKTAGFGIPLAERIDGADGYVQAIVLVPTRELARQVTGEVTRIVRYRGIRLVAVYGGAPMAPQIAGLEGGAQIVVGTPGRVIDLLDRGILRIDRVQTVILDEADQMLDIGFLPDIRRILRSTPRDRQTALFTATVPTMIRRLIYSYLRDPQWIRVGEESEPVDTVHQMYCEVARRDKLSAMLEVLDTIDHWEQTLVFRRTKEDVDWLVRSLKRKGIAVEAIHGGLPQGERNTVMQAFRDGKLKLLISTNLTSRGIDVPAVAHVINYDIPEQVDEYVHRIGRTARMGRDGTAVTFVSEWDIEFFEAIREHVGGENLEEIHLAMYAQPARGGGATSTA